ncbi:hypothetical protein DM01DRAFT_55385 [Hesseltinella vesiculosa]|uniref:Uncharacterized protein n=1 Tax=Hesseltinella vesiculosa TaxID=101127 RepID=A0A1X2GKJ8_9FUNG|nr:hypothetical protein DM01DRAFT_55385 [Hesseltinella vesiculosa]
MTVKPTAQSTRRSAAASDTKRIGVTISGWLVAFEVFSHLFFLYALGAIILLEERFTSPKHVQGLSKWIQRLRAPEQNPRTFGDMMADLRRFVEQRQLPEVEIHQ